MTKRLRWEGTTLLTMYVVYAAMMVCRNTVVVASPALIQDPTLGMDTARYGQMMAYGSLGGVVGKLTLGLVVDRLGGRRMLLLTLAFVAASTVSYGLASGVLIFFVINFLGHGVKSAGWPSMASIIGKWYSASKHGRVWGLISTGSRVGVMFSTLFLGYLLTFVSWQMTFFVAGGVAVIAFIIGHFLLKADPSKVGLSPPVDDEEEENPEPTERPPHRLDGFTLKQALWDFATSQRVWFISLSVGALTMLMDFNNFVPIYLAENLNLSPGLAGMTGTVFPAGCFCAALAGGFLYDRLSKRQHIFAFGGLLLVAAGSIMVLQLIPRSGLSPEMSLYATMAAVFMFGLAVAPAYYIPMSVFSVSYGGPRVGLLMGLIDAFGYLVAMTFNYFGGSIAQIYGWDAFLMVLLCTCLVAAALVARFMVLEAVPRRARLT